MPLFATHLGDWLLSRPVQDLADQLVPGVGGMLLLIAAAVLIYRALRENYLLSWIVGIAGLCVLRVASVLLEHNPDLRFLLIFASIGFGCACAAFVAAVYLYTNRVHLLPRLAPLAVAGFLVTLAHEIWWPNSTAGVTIGFVLWTALCVAGAVELALFTRGRRTIGPWLLVLVLVLFPAQNPQVPPLFDNSDFVISGLLGLSMLLVVVDDARFRNRRLMAMNAIVTALAQARDFGPMITTALEVLSDLGEARSAWFRLIDGDRLVITNQINVRQEFLRDRAVVTMQDSPTGAAIIGRVPVLMRIDESDHSTRERLRQEGFDHLLLVPVYGKSDPIGALVLAHDSFRTYRAGELEFLSHVASQLGIAVENLRLIDRILYSQRQWVNTFDSISDLVVVHDENYRVIRANRALAARLGVEPASASDRYLGDLLPHLDDHAGPCPYCDRDGSREASFGERPDPCFGGHSIVSSYSYSEDGSRRLGTIHIIHDTSEQRLAEQRYKLLFDGVQEGIFISTPEGKLVECNDTFLKMFGYESLEQARAMDIQRDLYADQQQRAVFIQEMDRRGFVRNYPVTLKRRDGTLLTCIESSFVTRAADGSVERYQGVLLDITEQKRAEDELRRRNRDLAVLNSIAVIATQSFELDHILSQTLRHVGELFSADSATVYLIEPGSTRLQRRAVFGSHWKEGDLAELALSQEAMSSIREQRVELITGDHIALAPEAVREFVARHGFQSVLWVVMWASDRPTGILSVSSRSPDHFRLQEQQLLIAIGRQLATTVEKVRLYDETARAYEHLSRTQEQLLQSEKMAAVGQLISGVAHELNNPLTAILGYAQLLDNEQLSERSRDFIGKIYRQAQRTHRVVQNLLSFARQRKPQKLNVDVRRVIDDTLMLRDYDLKLNHIEVERQYDGELPAVVADPHQLEQVFLNIINNAADAILEQGRGGKLRVRASATVEHLKIEFHDSGPGIREPNRVFDPFFTTKQVGKGTGLGLSICYGIIKEHGGEIAASNHLEGGAVFHITLPAVAPAAQPALVSVTPCPAEAMLRGRILIVDDEESVREFEREVLSSAGAEVVTAGSGEEALLALERQSFDVVILDGKMPGWTAGQIYSWISAHRPEERGRVLLTLSNVHDNNVDPEPGARKIPCLIKPFAVDELLAAVRRVLPPQAIAASAD